MSAHSHPSLDPRYYDPVPHSRHDPAVPAPSGRVATGHSQPAPLAVSPYDPYSPIDYRPHQHQQQHSPPYPAHTQPVSADHSPLYHTVTGYPNHPPHGIGHGAEGTAGGNGNMPPGYPASPEYARHDAPLYERYPPVVSPYGPIGPTNGSVCSGTPSAPSATSASASGPQKLPSLSAAIGPGGYSHSPSPASPYGPRSMNPNSYGFENIPTSSAPSFHFQTYSKSPCRGQENNAALTEGGTDDRPSVSPVKEITLRASMRRTPSGNTPLQGRSKRRGSAAPSNGSGVEGLPSNSHHLLNSPEMKHIRAPPGSGSGADGGEDGDDDAQGSDDEDVDAEGEEDPSIFPSGNLTGGDGLKAPHARGPTAGGADAANILLAMSGKSGDGKHGVGPRRKRTAKGKKSGLVKDEAAAGDVGDARRYRTRGTPREGAAGDAEQEHARIHVDSKPVTRRRSAGQAPTNSTTSLPPICDFALGPPPGINGASKRRGKHRASDSYTATTSGTVHSTTTNGDDDDLSTWSASTGETSISPTNGVVPASASGSAPTSTIGGHGHQFPPPGPPQMHLEHHHMAGLQHPHPPPLPSPHGHPHGAIAGPSSLPLYHHQSVPHLPLSHHMAGHGGIAGHVELPPDGPPGPPPEGGIGPYPGRRSFPPHVPIDPAFARLYRNFPVSSAFGDREPIRARAHASGVRVMDSPPCGIFNSPAHGHFDLYTPRFVKGVGSEKVGACCICAESKERGGEDGTLWLKMKVSSYSYHLSFYHGINNVNGLPFSPPVAIRIARRAKVAANEKTELKEGQCHECTKWIPLEGIKMQEVKVPELFWWKHAKACHKSRIPGEGHVHIRDQIFDLVQAQAVATAGQSSYHPHAHQAYYGYPHHPAGYHAQYVTSPASTATSSGSTSTRVHPSVAAQRASAGRVYKRKMDGMASHSASGSPAGSPAPTTALPPPGEAPPRKARRSNIGSRLPTAEREDCYGEA